MEYRQLGKSGLKLPVISFGAWAIGGWLWGGTDDTAAVRALQKAIDLGMTCIDTAAIYGMGHSERLVGRAIAGRRDQVIVATKCGVRWDIDKGHHVFDSKMNDGTPVQIRRYLGAGSIKRECEESLDRLGVDVIDLYQCHQIDPTTPVEETMEAMLSLQQEGKIREIGVSNFTVELLERCLREVALASDQPLYNPLERAIEKDVLPFCAKHQIGVLAYSPIAQGLMTGRVTLDREFPESDVRKNRPWFKPENRKMVLELLAKIQPIAEGYGATLGQVAINWVISQPGITSALVGARNERQVEENVKAAEFRLTVAELAQIREWVEALGAPV